MSESLLSNPLKFETNPYHNVVMKDRKSLDLTGVKQIDSFDSNEFLFRNQPRLDAGSGQRSDAGQAGHGAGRG